jgi:four helix bundle protein
MDLSEDIFKISENFPDNGRYDIKSQIRRAVMSISSNIAEGSGAGTYKHQLNYLQIAVASCNEVESLSNFAKRIGLIDDQTLKNIENAVAESRRPLYGLIKHIKEKNNL